MRKALVLELKKTYAVVSEQGIYLRVVQKEGMEIGRTILFTEDDILASRQRSKTNRRQRLVPVMATFLLVFVLLGSFYNNNYMAYSAVTIDINPSIELVLNKKDQVLKMNALNADAETLTLNELKGLSVDVAVNEIIEEAKVKGFIQAEEKSYVVLTSVALRAKSEDLETSLQYALREKVAKLVMDDHLTVAISESTKALLNEAKEVSKPLALVRMQNSMDISEVESVKELFENQDHQQLFQMEGQIYEVKHQNREGIDERELPITVPESTYQEECVQNNRNNYQESSGNNLNGQDKNQGNGNGEEAVNGNTHQNNQSTTSDKDPTANQNGKDNNVGKQEDVTNQDNSSGGTEQEDIQGSEQEDPGNGNTDNGSNGNDDTNDNGSSGDKGQQGGNGSSGSGGHNK